MKKILRVDVGTGTAVFEDLPEAYATLSAAGQLTSAIVAAEVGPDVRSAGPAQQDRVRSGLLAGTTAPNSSRLSVGCKSPLTGGIKESNSGGQAAQQAGTSGCGGGRRAGRPRRQEVGAASEQGRRQADRRLHRIGARATTPASKPCTRAYGDKVASMSCGPGGELGYRNSSVAVTDPEVTRRATPDGAASVPSWPPAASRPSWSTTPAPNVLSAADAERFDKARKTLVDGLKAHPVTSGGLPAFGTAILVNIINEAGGLPTHNFHFGRFDKAEAISGETLSKNCDERGGKHEHACMTGCVVHCSNVYVDKAGDYVTSGVEYESIWALGANCDNGDLDAIARWTRLCDDIGIDTIEMGDTFAVAMEGGLLPWGDAQRMIETPGQRGPQRARTSGAGSATAPSTPARSSA